MASAWACRKKTPRRSSKRRSSSDRASSVPIAATTSPKSSRRPKVRPESAARARSGAADDGAEDLPKIGDPRGLAAMGADEADGILDPGDIGGPRAQRRILQTDAHMAAARHRLADERPDIGADAGDHPRRLEQVEIGSER